MRLSMSSSEAPLRTSSVSLPKVDMVNARSRTRTREKDAQKGPRTGTRGTWACARGRRARGAARGGAAAGGARGSRAAEVRRRQEALSSGAAQGTRGKHRVVAARWDRPTTHNIEISPVRSAHWSRRRPGCGRIRCRYKERGGARASPRASRSDRPSQSRGGTRVATRKRKQMNEKRKKGTKARQMRGEGGRPGARGRRGERGGAMGGSHGDRMSETEGDGDDGDDGGANDDHNDGGAGVCA